jgi:hypothetical protein
MNSFLKRLWQLKHSLRKPAVAIGVGLSTMLAYQALYDRILSKTAFIDQLRWNDIPIIKKDIAAALLELELFQNSWPSLENKVQNISNINEFINSYHQEMGKFITKCNNRISDLEEFLRDNNLNLFEDNFISKLITEFKDYLSTLSIEQLCILIDFLLITLVFSCLITILVAFYGNFLIDKFSLEEKYPKLSVIIKLRRKFQHYYIITNSLIIIFALLFMGYVNLLTLLNGS